MLNDTRVRNAKRADRPIKLSDSGGLHLLIQPNGSKLWRLAYRFGGKQKTLAIGSYPTVTLKHAREKRDEAKRLLADHIDPSTQRRLEKLLSDRDAVKNELKDQKAETQHRIRMVKAFPKAFFFDFVGREKDLLRFNFYPNPEFSPKDRETQMYRGMEGTMLVEPVQERIVQVRGKLVKDVSFGWGIFGRLSKGGIYEIVQTQLSPGKWRISTLNVDVKGRIFLLNSFRFIRRESDSLYRPVQPPMSYRSAVKALLAAPPLPEKSSPAGAAAPARSHGSQRPGD